MTLTLGNSPFGPQSTGQFNFERNGPAHVIYWEDWPRRMRAVFAGETVLDSRRGKVLHETAILPVHYFPEEDVRMDLLTPTDHSTHCPFKGDAAYWTLTAGDRVAENVVWGYSEPLDHAPPLKGYVAFYYPRLDTWFEEDEEIYAHPKDPYHRVDVLSASRHVVARHDGAVIAETRAPKLLFETGLPVRYYLPPDHVDWSKLDKSDTVSPCPYKGDGQHWHLVNGGENEGRVEDVGWTLPTPRPEGAAAAGHLCFYPGKVELTVDGEPVGD